MSEHLIVYCTCPDGETADRLAGALVEQGLAACVAVLPGVRSTYRWQGRLEQADEFQLQAKTTRTAYPALEAALLRQHPYELPEIVAVPIAQGLAGYLAWIDDNVTNENT